MKAVFLDYTGTMVKEDEPYTRELLSYFISHSEVKDPEEAMGLVWGMIKEIELKCFGDGFIGKDEMVERILSRCRAEYGLSGDMEYMHDIWRRTWIYAPLYEDVKPFFTRASCPIYVVTNDDLKYIKQSLEIKDLHPAGIVAAEMVRACKPHGEIFRKALETAGVEPGEAVHIGDSVSSDVEPARAAGISPILIDRTGKAGAADCRVIQSLDELFSE
ncbi:MAG: HAD family hydrolase [Oscillospiraceae bacterium]|nr:HAD family hydrolase [Oscillospiraceae bacterium]